MTWTLFLDSVTAFTSQKKSILLERKKKEGKAPPEGKNQPNKPDFVWKETERRISRKRNLRMMLNTNKDVF